MYIAVTFWLIILMRGNTWRMVLMIPITMALAVNGYAVYQDLLGDPTTSEYLGEYRLVDSLVDEPTAIFLWVLPNDAVALKPKNLELPYTKEMHKKLDEAKRAKAKGIKTDIKLKRGKGNQRKVFMELLKQPEQPLPRKQVDQTD
jgi:hypothetical protein